MRHGMVLGCYVVLSLLLVGCGGTSEACTSALDAAPRLAIISAYEPELERLLEEVKATDSYVVNGRTYTVGQLGGHDVLIGLSGISMVNAAMTTQALLDHFDIQAVVFSGIAGGVNPNLNIGDVVIPAKWGQYQEQVFARETDQGWDVGWHGREFGNFGMMFPQRVGVTSKNRRPDAEQEHFWFPVDAAMLEAAQNAVQDVHLSRCTAKTKCLDDDPGVVIGGNGVSGASFVDNAEYRQWVWETFQADALDMETAAVAHVAYVNDVPFIAFRSLSDLAGGGPGQNELPTFFQLAADNSAEVVMAFLAYLPQ